MVSAPEPNRVPPDRSSERGAAMFIVLMVILILSAIGTFALSNARYELQTSGFTRQRSVSLEMASLGNAVAMSEVAANPVAYRDKIRATSSMASPERCTSLAGLSGLVPPPPCYHLYPQDVEARLGLATDHLIRPTTAGNPGSFGMSAMSGGFVVELTDPMDVVRPIPGAPIDGSPGTPQFLDFTVTSTGLVFPDDNMNAIVDWSLGEGRGAVFTSGRGHLIVGPISVK
jgi:hypothetical protein